MRRITLHMHPVKGWRTSVAHYATTITCNPGNLRGFYRRTRLNGLDACDARMIAVAIFAIDWQQSPPERAA